MRRADFVMLCMLTGGIGLILLMAVLSVNLYHNWKKPPTVYEVTNHYHNHITQVTEEVVQEVSVANMTECIRIEDHIWCPE